MTRIVQLDVMECLPEPEAVLIDQGVPENTAVSAHIRSLAEKALELLSSAAEPEYILKEISVREFADVFVGEGNNEDETPLEYIYPRAKNLALCTFTLGGGISEQIERLFEENEFALGSMLDTAASLAADKASGICESHHFRDVSQKQDIESALCTLWYSPGYCGWHITAQKKLFHYLEPDKIGISLNESCLMIPLKSVSGVLVSGEREIHIFKTDFTFCSSCKTFVCRERMKQLAITEKSKHIGD